MKNTKGYKIYNFIMKIISWCVMSILVVTGGLLLTIVVLNKIADAKGELSPMGLYTIISPSMTPDIDVYDVVFVVRKDPNDIEIGDIVSYYSTISTIGDIPVTHRVVEKFNTNTGVSFRTKGDANQVVDNEIVMGERVIGTVRFVIPFLGRIQFFLASKGGWFIAILIPALAIIAYDIVKLIKLLSVKNKMKQVSNENITIKKEKNLYQEKPSRKEKLNDNYKKTDNYTNRKLNNNYEYDDELNRSKIKRNRESKYDYNKYSFEKDESNLIYNNQPEYENLKDEYDDYYERKNSLSKSKYEYNKKIGKNKKRETNYEEELNRLIDKLNEQDETENYSKRRNDYYAQKRSSRK